MCKGLHGVEGVSYHAFFGLPHYTGVRGHGFSVHVERSKLNDTQKISSVKGLCQFRIGYHSIWLPHLL